MMASEAITKLDAAKRQLNEAIRLFFERRDMVCVHTLAAAAGQILADLCGKKGLLIGIRDESIIRPERRKEWFQKLSEAENFFKHADRDPEAVHGFVPEVTEIILFDAVWALQRLCGKQTYEAGVYYSWVFLKYPNVFVDGDFKQQIRERCEALSLSWDDLDAFSMMLKTKGATKQFPGTFLD